MTKVLIIGGGGGLMAAIVAKLSQELVALDCEVVPADRLADFATRAPDTLTLRRQLGDWPSGPLALHAQPLDASPKLITAGSGGGAASGYTEFVARRGGVYGASRRRP